MLCIFLPQVYLLLEDFHRVIRHSLGQIRRLPARGSRRIFLPFCENLNGKKLKNHSENKKNAEISGLYVFHKIPLSYFCFLVPLDILKHTSLYFSTVFPAFLHG